MMSKKVTVIMLTSLFVRGVMYSKGDEVEVNQREAQELINRGAATDEANVGVSEDTTVAIEDMKKDDLIKYATELGIDVPSKVTKDEIIELINALDDEDGEE
jgi:hypothetical protein